MLSGSHPIKYFTNVFYSQKNIHLVNWYEILQSVKLNFNALILNGFTGNEVFMSERYNFIYLQ